MIFFTLFFFTLALSVLVKGRLFKDLRIEFGEAEIKKASNPDYKFSNELLSKLLFLFIGIVFYIITFITYLIKALSIDPYVYPTIIMILFIVSSYVFNKNTPKDDLKTEEGIEAYRKKLSNNKRKLKGILKNFIAAMYFVYMFYILVF